MSGFDAAWRAQAQSHMAGRAPDVLLDDLKDAIGFLGEMERDLEEREAACCPEDFGFEEYIKILEKQRDAFREALRETCDALRMADDGDEYYDEGECVTCAFCGVMGETRGEVEHGRMCRVGILNRAAKLLGK